MKKYKPTFQSISNLPLMCKMIEEPLKEAEGLYKNLQEAKDKPQVMDDETVDRAIDLYTKEMEMDWVYEEQLKRWLSESPDEKTKREIIRLQEQRKRYKEVANAIIALGKKLKEGTIDRIKELNDAELGLRAFLGGFKYKNPTSKPI